MKNPGLGRSGFGLFLLWVVVRRSPGLGGLLLVGAEAEGMQHERVTDRGDRVVLVRRRDDLFDAPHDVVVGLGQRLTPLDSWDEVQASPQDVVERLVDGPLARVNRVPLLLSEPDATPNEIIPDRLLRHAFPPSNPGCGLMPGLRE